MLKTAYTDGWNAAFAKLALSTPAIGGDSSNAGGVKAPSLKMPASMPGMAEFPQATPGGVGKGFTGAQSSGISPGVAASGLSGFSQSFGN
jgi:hypothetical protein